MLSVLGCNMFWFVWKITRKSITNKMFGHDFKCCSLKSSLGDCIANLLKFAKDLIKHHVSDSRITTDFDLQSQNVRTVWMSWSLCLQCTVTSKAFQKAQKTIIFKFRPLLVRKWTLVNKKILIGKGWSLVGRKWKTVDHSLLWSPAVHPSSLYVLVISFVKQKGHTWLISIGGWGWFSYLI